MDRKLRSIQYLRAAAALLVVVAHALDHPLSTENFDLARLGRLGVVMFFAISGFIMVAITGSGRFEPIDFLKRRFIRIVPLYWLATTLIAILVLLLPGLFKTTAFNWPHYLQSLFFIPHEAPNRPGMATPMLTLGWTLNFEIYFYLWFALLAVLTARSRVIAMTVIFLALTIAGFLFRPEAPALRSYLDYAPLAFCAGAWVGLAYLNGALARLTPVSVALIGCVGAAALITAFAIDRGSSGAHLVFAMLIILSVALVIAAVHSEARLNWGFLKRLGDASYAIYLVHIFVVGGVTALAYRIVSQGDPVAVALVVTFCVVLSTLGGLLVYEFAERPILRHLNRIAGTRRVDQNAGPTSERPARFELGREQSQAPEIE